MSIAKYVNGSTTPSKEYIYAGSALLATIAGTSATYHHPDHLSNRSETAATGAIVRYVRFFGGNIWPARVGGGYPHTPVSTASLAEALRRADLCRRAAVFILPDTTADKGL